MSYRRALVAIALAVVTAACGQDEVATPTGPSAATFTTRFFSNVIDSGGSRFYSFKVTNAGPVAVTLASVTNDTTGLPADRPLRIGVGRPQGTGCAVAATALTSASLVMQLSHLAPEGINCVEVADTVGGPGSVRFTIRFSHP